ncbi:glycosyltransferase family 2 protein [Ectobacillus polymachus]|uniref:glycosyltransferase family 2 protein n=1 Tax=Ectobacillus polymachus TaxID=1508806 RepID=UPI003A8C3530
MNDFLVVVPAFNEEQNLKQVIPLLKRLQMPMDIVIINDGSSDKTEQTARELGARVVSHPTNLGYMAAVQTGFKYAKKQHYPYILFFDGDGQHDPNCIKDMMKAIQQEDVDVVIGSRFLQKSDMEIGVLKLAAVQFFRFIIFQITKKRITDPTSGFKAYKAKAYSRFTNTNTFNYDLPDSNFIIDILLQNLKILEIPVNMYDRQHGESKIHQTGLKPLIYISQVLLSILIVTIKNKVKGGKTR